MRSLVRRMLTRIVVLTGYVYGSLDADVYEPVRGGPAEVWRG